MQQSQKAVRVLFITSHYPPSDHGWGLMQLCEEVADGLFAKGHQITVLTSTYGSNGETPHPYPVHRLLSIDPDWYGDKPGALQFFMGRRQREQQAVASLRQLVSEFRPHMIFVWDFLGLSRVMLQQAEQMPNLPVAYYMANFLPELDDEYMEYWDRTPHHWASKLAKLPLAKLALHMLAREGKPISLQYDNVVCVSDYLRRRLVSEGSVSSNAVVIYNGVDLTRFDPESFPARPPTPGAFRCVVIGRVVPEKGLHTAIEAWGLLREREELNGTKLTILGDGPAGYMAQLRERVAHLQLHDSVKFSPPIPREQIPEALSSYDLLILPSEYAEPLARAMQEAMAMGLLVIGTTTG
ncbi:MAG: glycosyltransferase, partial [Anaerolineae bacterium]|nr:glycosyltransferase [Anaerolineae bacterium]